MSHIQIHKASCIVRKSSSYLAVSLGCGVAASLQSPSDTCHRSQCELKMLRTQGVRTRYMYCILSHSHENVAGTTIAILQQKIKHSRQKELKIKIAPFTASSFNHKKEEYISPIFVIKIVWYETTNSFNCSHES